MSKTTDVASAVAELHALPDLNDVERAHGVGDEILLRFVPPEVAAAFREVRDRDGWWYA